MCSLLASPGRARPGLVPSLPIPSHSVSIQRSDVAARGKDVAWHATRHVAQRVARPPATWYVTICPFASPRLRAARSTRWCCMLCVASNVRVMLHVASLCADRHPQAVGCRGACAAGGAQKHRQEEGQAVSHRSRPNAAKCDAILASSGCAKTCCPPTCNETGVPTQQEFASCSWGHNAFNSLASASGQAGAATCRPAAAAAAVRWHILAA